jgi:hypothetical protein
MVKHSAKGSRKAKKEARSRKNTPEGGKKASKSMMRGVLSSRRLEADISISSKRPSSWRSSSDDSWEEGSWEVVR